MKLNLKKLQALTHYEIFKVFEAGFDIPGLYNPVKEEKCIVKKDAGEFSIEGEDGIFLASMRFSNRSPDYLQFDGGDADFSHFAAVRELVRLGAIEL